jgi:glycosyltransferase-like protein
MRIALLTYSTKPRGGVVHTLALAEALADRGHGVTIWTLGRGGDSVFFRPVHPSVSVRVVPFAAEPDETVGDRIMRSISTLRAAFSEKYDVVHAQDCISANAVPWCIRTIHHLDHFTTPELADCHEKAIVKPVARICVSAAVAAEVQSGWGYTPAVIPNGVHAERYVEAAGPSSAAVAGRKFWRDQLGRYVLAVGGIEPRKGSIDLLVAFARVRSAIPDVRLVFAGGETLFDYRGYREQFDRLALELDIPYTMVGVVADDQMPSLIAASSALAFVSLKEGFGLAAMEALAAGVPVIARDLPVLHEVLGGAALYADGPEAITGALVSALTGQAPDPEAGVALARGYRWDAVAAQHENFYRQVLAGHAAGPDADQLTI